jgi:hypothetical protein
MPLGPHSFGKAGIDIDDVRECIEELLPVRVSEHRDGTGYGFYPAGKGNGSQFAAVRSGPRLYLDPTAKQGVLKSTPQIFLDDSRFERSTGSWGDGLGYTVMLRGEEEVPAYVQDAIIASYDATAFRRSR